GHSRHIGCPVPTMVGSGVTLDPSIPAGIRAMTPADMEHAITKLDRRLEAVEQFLPTLATRDELLATRSDLHTEIVATKKELAAEIVATKKELAAEILT